MAAALVVYCTYAAAFRPPRIARLGARPDRFVHPRPTGTGEPESRAHRRSAHALAPRDARSDRPAADARRSRRVPRRPSPDAYERVVDRLLASPRYGERMAVRWLDAARYADTSGYQSDGERHHVAVARLGDRGLQRATCRSISSRSSSSPATCCPKPTLEQRIATGFNRNHRGNAEGGIIPEEYAVEYVVDRVETTTTVWLGLTLGCARCHDHKFDPFTQAEFYQPLRLLQQRAGERPGDQDRQLAAVYRSSDPACKRRASDSELQLASSRLLPNKRGRKGRAISTGPRLRNGCDDYEPIRTADESDATSDSRGLVAQFDYDEPSGRVFDGERVSSTPATSAISASSTRSRSRPGSGSTQAAAARSSRRMTDVHEGDGYQLAIVDGKLQLNLVKRWLDDALRVETAAAARARPLAPRGGQPTTARGDRLEGVRSTSTASQLRKRCCSTS